MKNWYLIPLAAVAGLIAGAWGPRADLETLKDAQVVKQAKTESNQKSGFGAITQLVNIPARSRPRRFEPEKDTNTVEGVASTNETAEVAPRRRHRMPWRNSEDLKNRIEDAKDLWKTRSELARTQWKSKLNVSEAQAKRFDEMVDAMNADLKDLMSEFAEEVAQSKTISPELGVKMLSAVTRTLSEGYDALGECVDPSVREEVANMPLHEFIDPSVIEPMIKVQDYVETDNQGDYSR